MLTLEVSNKHDWIKIQIDFSVQNMKGIMENGKY